MRMELALRFDYGRTVPWVTAIDDGIRAVAGPNLAILHARFRCTAKICTPSRTSP